MLKESHRATKLAMRGHARLEKYVQMLSESRHANKMFSEKIKLLEKQMKETK
jgi:hypothetical protein